MDRAELAGFLRTRRAVLQPEDVGLPRGPRRRTDGLRREEVAALIGMSTDYYARLERQRGPRPSEQMVAAIARGLQGSLDERDHLFLLAGHGTPRRALRGDHVDVGLMRVLDRLDDTPAQIITHLGETPVQTPVAVALPGDETGYTGLARSAIYRWFSTPGARVIYPAADHKKHSRIYAARLRDAATRDPRAAALAATLRADSAEFAGLWSEHQVGLRYTEEKRIVHPEVGLLRLHCQVLLDPDQSQLLLVFTATPGSESAERLRLLSVLGTQRR